MIYFYRVKLCFFINNDKVFKDYIVSFAELTDFLYNKKKKNSSMEIYSIKPYYSDKPVFLWCKKSRFN